MSAIPPTSVTLLKDLSGDATSVRWTEFVNMYSEPMRAFLRARYPAVEAEDVIQETFIALVKCLPRYRYVPDEHGYFHNYLIGIVDHKAKDAVRRQAAHAALKKKVEEEEKGRTIPLRQPDDEAAEAAWQNDVKEVALQQLVADDSIAPSTREIFRHVAIMHERPVDVARLFGVTRNNVDQIKARMIARLKALISSMIAARDAP